MKDLEEIKKRLFILETTSKSRWDAHDEKSKENWTNMQHSLEKFDANLNTLFNQFNDACKISIAKKGECMKEARDFTERTCSRAIGWTLGIPAVLITLITFIVELHKLFTK